MRRGEVAGLCIAFNVCCDVFLAAREQDELCANKSCGFHYLFGVVISTIGRNDGLNIKWHNTCVV